MKSIITLWQCDYNLVRSYRHCRCHDL